MATNQKDAQAAKGQSVIVTLNAAEQASVLPNLTIGQKCTIASSSKIGYIDSIDYAGTSFEVQPVNMASYFDSATTPGKLLAAETITIV